MMNRFYRKSVLRASRVFVIGAGLAASSGARSDDSVVRAVDTAGTRLAVVTGKEGVASGLAHRHIIVARGAAGTVVTKKSPTAASGEIQSAVADVEFAVDQMAVDQEADASAVIPDLVAAGVWDQAKDKIEPSNSEKVRANMLDESQLDAKKFATITGHGELSQCQPVGGGESRCSLALTLRVKGVAVTRNLQARVTGTGDAQEARFVVPVKFSEFGIKPYSAMMGAIRVSDEMVISVAIKTKK